MRSILVTGGTVFVSKYVAEYFASKGDQVYVLNRNTRLQPKNTILLQGDRHKLGSLLKDCHFDVVVDVTAYTGEDVVDLCAGLGGFDSYIMISSSAVYPETNAQPFIEEQPIGDNRFWGEYGTNKVDAEKALKERVPHAYILRPPYLYGPMNNVYRESFVFDCALSGRKFYLPNKGELPLQFFYIGDLCRMIEVLIQNKPVKTIYNVGNPECVTVKEWVELCYEIAGASCELVPVHQQINPRAYFCFADYSYKLDVSEQDKLLSELKPFKEGLREAFLWYQNHESEVAKRPYLDYIDNHFMK